jgi:osmotically-inducible protein OsmY
MTIHSIRTAAAAFAAVIALATPAATYAFQQTPAPKPPTADKQSEAKADLAITQKIRRAVVKDKSLSLMAHNCKIITQHGAVTLRGYVKTDVERTTIGEIAATIAGADKVTNQLTVKAKK